jgi:hypothetical protein
VRTVLETYGKNILSYLYHPMGDRAVQLVVVFDKETAGPASRLYRKQP